MNRVKTKPPEQRGRGDRIPDSELKRRVKQVTDMMIAGVSDGDIVQFCAEKWSAHEDTGRRYIQAANEHLRVAFNHDTKSEAQKALRRYQDLYYRTRAAGDFKTAASIQDRICKLLRLWEDVIRHEAGDTLTQFLQSIRRNGTTG